MRLHKFLAECGLGSRRKCEQLIADGQIEINNTVVTRLGVIIDAAKDNISYKGKSLSSTPLTYWVLNKPKGVVCSCRKDNKYKRVIDLVPNNQCRVYPAGRLDVQSEGLIIITNDGSLCDRITHPKYGITKEYLVWIDKPLNHKEREKIKNGVTIVDGPPVFAIINEEKLFKSNMYRVRLTLNEGRNREIRKIFTILNKKVIRLKRTRLGTVKLNNLKQGEYRKPGTKKEITDLKTGKNSKIRFF